MAKSDAQALMEILSGSLTLQLVLWRFLAKEGIIDRDRLLASVAERAHSWESTASAEALIPVLLFLSGMAAEAEPGAPPTLH